MTKTNVQICSNCGAENALFEKTCKVCRHYIRASVVNIDLWRTTWQIFEVPTKALTGVIHAEHKNFLFFLLFLLSLKLYSLGVIFQSAAKITYPVSSSFVLNLLIQLVIYSVPVLLFAFILKMLISIKRGVRFRDVLAVTVYSFIPMILAFVLFAPVQFGIYGVHWFTYNPSPFLIKNALAYILSVLEIIMIVWSLFVFVKGIYLQAGSWLFTAAAALLFLIMLSSIMIFIPFVLL